MGSSIDKIGAGEALARRFPGGFNIVREQPGPPVVVARYRPDGDGGLDLVEGMASCGHPRDADGACGCPWWPERAPVS